jgi:BlaI family transcriptional regulator, penicillinase repressor
MKKPLRISDTEWELMRVVWARHPLTANELVARLQERDASWHPKTARTLLARLVRKGAIGFERTGRAFAYAPLATEADCIAAASASFVERVFGGAMRPLLAHLVESRKITPADLDELRDLLAKTTAGNQLPKVKRKAP